MRLNVPWNKTFKGGGIPDEQVDITWKTNKTRQKEVKDNAAAKFDGGPKWVFD